MPDPIASDKPALPSPGPGRAVLNASRRFLFLISMTYLLMLTPLVYLQRSLIFAGRPCPPLLAKQIAFPQTTIDLVVKSFDGVDLHGWIALAGTSSHSEPIEVKEMLSNGRPVVLYFPGNAGNRSYRFTQIVTLVSLNAHVVIVDYRGYADNGGSPSEKSFARDARSIWNHLTNQLGIPPDRIVLYGESLGGGSATRLASDLCLEGIHPGGLIAQSTFSSLVAAARYHFPIVPVSWILVDRFPSDQRIRNVTCPILQIHGALDSIVPLRIGQTLFDAAPATSSTGIAKKQVVLPRTDHNDVYFNEDFDLVKSELAQFLDAVASAPRADKVPTPVAKEPQNPGADDAGFNIFESPLLRAIAVLVIAVVLWWLLGRKPAPKP